MLKKIRPLRFNICRPSFFKETYNPLVFNGLIQDLYLTPISRGFIGKAISRRNQSEVIAKETLQLIQILKKSAFDSLIRFEKWPEGHESLSQKINQIHSVCLSAYHPFLNVHFEHN